MSCPTTIVEGFQDEQAQNHKHIRYLEEQVLELKKQITNIQGPEVDFDAIPLCSAEGCGAQAAFACAGGDPVCAAHAAPCARCGRGPFCGECRTEVGHTCAPSRPPPDACGTAGAEANSAQLDVLNTSPAERAEQKLDVLHEGLKSDLVALESSVKARLVGLMASAADFSEAKVRLGKLELAVESLTSVQFHYEMNECLQPSLEKLNAHVKSLNKDKVDILMQLDVMSAIRQYQPTPHEGFMLGLAELDATVNLLDGRGGTVIRGWGIRKCGDPKPRQKRA